MKPGVTLRLPTEYLPDHFDPDAWDDHALHVIPLGGVGEIGMNNMLYCQENTRILIDCGALFPDDSLYGVDLIVPDYTYLLSEPEKLKAIILTHGHEDHIGSLPFVLKEVNVPVYGPPYALGIVRRKLEEHDLPHKPQLIPIHPGDKLNLGLFQFRFLRVNHSIPDCLSVVIDTPHGRLLHTGDFRMDVTPAPQDHFDYAGFGEIGDQGVTCLLSDSTNVEVPGFTASEQDVGRALLDVFMEAKGKVFVSCFASSIPRIQEILSVCKKTGRHIHFSGRSMQTHLGVAQQTGYVKLPYDLLIPEEAVSQLPPDKVCVVLTGSQGEFRSSLVRIATGEHKQIKIQEGDTVIFSSRIIPGHERAINRLIDTLYRQGAEVVTSKNAQVHTSGHGHAGELLTMLNLVRPKHFIPVHGEWRHLVKHGRLAQKVGIESRNVHLIQSGDVVQFNEEQCSLVGRVVTGRVFVDGKGVGDVAMPIIQQRRKMAETGLIVTILVLEGETGKILSGPDIISRGVTLVEDEQSQKFFTEAKQRILRLLDELPPRSIQDVETLKEEMRLSVRRVFHKALERKPVVIPVVIQM